MAKKKKKQKAKMVTRVKRPKAKKFGIYGPAKPGEYSLIERTGLMVADVDEFGQIHPSLRSTFRETAKNIRRRI